MTGRLARLLLLGIAMLSSIGAAFAESRVLIARDDSAVASQAAGLLAGELAVAGWTVVDSVVVGDRDVIGRAGDEQVVVALGSRAFLAALRHSGGRAVVGALIASSALDEPIPAAPGEQWSAIVLDQPVDRWVNLLQAAFPGVHQVGMLVGPKNQRMFRAVERKMAERRMTLSVEQVVAAEDVVHAIERLIPRMGVFLALPDSLVHNRNTVQPLLLTTYRAGIPVVAYSESYQQAGAVLGLYSTVPQIVTQIIESLQQVREGRTLPNIQSPRYFTVGVNTSVARSLGLSLPPTSELTSRARSTAQ